MGAVPRKKVTRHYRGNRRQHQRLKAPVLVICPSCGERMQAHRACRSCGMYGKYERRQVLRVKDKAAER